MFDERKRDLMESSDTAYTRGLIGKLEEFDGHLMKAKFRFVNLPGVGKTLVELFPDPESTREWPEPIYGNHPDRMPSHGSAEWRELAEDYEEFDYARLCALIHDEWEERVADAESNPVLELQDLGLSKEEWAAIYADAVWDECVPQNWD